MTSHQRASETKIFAETKGKAVMMKKNGDQEPKNGRTQEKKIHDSLVGISCNHHSKKTPRKMCRLHQKFKRKRKNTKEIIEHTYFSIQLNNYNEHSFSRVRQKKSDFRN